MPIIEKFCRDRDYHARMTELLRADLTAPVLSAFDLSPCSHRHFYVSIDDGLYLEKCVLCDEPKQAVVVA